MATLTVNTVTQAGIAPVAGVQITAWSGTGDAILASDVGEKCWVEVSNTSGGSLDFRISDAGYTPAGNAAANGYQTYTLTTGSSRKIAVTKNNVDPATQAVKVGASTSNANFTVAAYRI